MAKILKIITDPNPILRNISEPVENEDINDPKMIDFTEDMKKTMLEKDGVGLAAPQVGENIRLIVVNTKDGVLPMFNPQITKRSFGKYWEQEGCLSLPMVFGDVKRCKKITCIYRNIKGEKIELKAEGLLARIIQHEVDHLNGILFTDRAKRIHKEE
ncbi:peptide deformylase [Candidatus Falkowbacteria bacterium]|nr:peptide deformylase [Candidatus Falkowbacteria bacterium]